MEKRSKNIGFKISENEANKIEEIYPSLNFGAQRAIKSWIPLRQSTLRGLKGIFNSNELKCLTELLIDIRFEPNLAHNPQILVTALKDSVDFGKILDFDINNLVTKILSLKPAEIFFLQEAIELTIEEGKDISELFLFKAN